MVEGSLAAGRFGLLAGICVACVAARPDAAGAFAVLDDEPGMAVEEILSRTERWSADERVAASLRGGIEMRVHPDFEEDLGATNEEEVEIVRSAVRDAFAAWENAALRFEIEFESHAAIPGPDRGGEIDVFTRSGDEPPFLLNPKIFGFGSTAFVSLPQRLLTNGQRVDGWVIVGGEVELNATLLRQTQEDLGIGIELASLALTRLLMHEIGHTLGLDHPNERRNFDTDFDPETGAVVDPRDPFAGIVVSPNFLQSAIMSNEPCGGPFEETGFCLALIFQVLQPDDRLGRDVLYPVPEPGLIAGYAAALFTLVLLAHGRRRQRLRSRRRTTRRTA